MKKLKKLIATIAVLTIAVSAMGCKMIEKTPEAIQNTVLATVGNEKITKGDFDKVMSKYDAQLKQQFGENYATDAKVKDQVANIKKEQLDRMVMEKVLLKKATDLNLKPSDEDINKQVDAEINNYKTQYAEEGQFESALQQSGMTEAELRELIKTSAIISPVQKDMFKDIEITDDVVQTYYNENKDTKYSVGAGATVAHILVADEQVAKDLKAKLDAGADFATVAKESSSDPGTKDKGGSLGFVAYNSTQLVPEFVNGFKSLKEGEISQPVKSQFGYHIIKATGLKESEITPLDQVKEEIKATLLQQKQTETFDSKIKEWKTELKATTYEDRL